MENTDTDEFVNPYRSTEPITNPFHHNAASLQDELIEDAHQLFVIRELASLN